MTLNNWYGEITALQLSSTAGALSKKNVVKGLELSILSVAALFQILLKSAGHQDIRCDETVLIWLFQRVIYLIHQYTNTPMVISFFPPHPEESSYA